jgi:hypothetical protein
MSCERGSEKCPTKSCANSGRRRGTWFPKYGRYWKDQPGQHERLRVVVSLGNVTQTVAERNLRDHIRQTHVDSPESFMEVTSPTITLKKQAEWWFDEMRAGRIVNRKKRAPIKPATLAGYQAAVNWLNETIGDTPLADGERS